MQRVHRGLRRTRVNPAKHYSVEDVPGLSPEEALALVVSAKPLFGIDQKIVLKLAQD